MLSSLSTARAAGVALLIFCSTSLASTPLFYEINSPLYDGTPHKVTIYQQDDFAVGVHNPADQSALGKGKNARPGLVGEGPPFAALPGLDGRLLKGQRLNRWYFRIPELEELEVGRRYTETIDPADPRESPYQRQWWIENFEIRWRDGDNDRVIAGFDTHHVVVETSYDYYWEDGNDAEPQHERTESRRDFWFTGAHPFSPLQLLPHRHLNDSRFVFFGRKGASRANEHAYRQLLPRLRDAGMLVGTRIEFADRTETIELQRIETDRDVDVDRYRSWPRIPESREDGAVGALMMREMIRDATDANPASELRLVTEKDSQALPATASFQVTQRGDLAIALTFEADDGASGMLLLLRAHHGRPEPGDYATASIIDRGEMGAMTIEELQAYALDFQAFGVLEDAEGKLTTYTSLGEGGIKLTRSEEQGLAGRFDIQVRAVELYGSGDSEPRRLSGKFDATRPLEGRMVSPVTQMLRIKQR
jgi:hypothetical protein